MSQRTQDLSASLQDYLEAILCLVTASGVARVKEIAARLGVNKSSVTSALHTLAERDLIEYEPYGYVTLTRVGNDLAEQVAWRHTVVREFLTGVLGIASPLADETACKMEHALPPVVVARLKEFCERFRGRPGGEEPQPEGLGPDDPTRQRGPAEEERGHA